MASVMQGGRGGRREDCIGVVGAATASTAAKAGTGGAGRRQVSLGYSSSVNLLVLLRDRV